MKSKGWRGSLALGVYLGSFVALATLGAACGEDETTAPATTTTRTTTTSTVSVGGSGGEGGSTGGAGGEGGSGGMAPTCMDNVQNGEETDVDCGGSLCPTCDNGETCLDPEDCTSGFCDMSGGAGGSGGAGQGVCAACDDVSDCQTGEFCDNGECVPTLANGTVCTLAEQCASGNCVDGYCCDTACGGGAAGDCQACNVTALLGTCSSEPAMTACGSAVDDECTNPDTCDGSGSCQANNEVSGTACGDQGVACHVNDTCDGSGSCTDNGFLAAGDACGDSSDTECTNPDTCNATGSCLANHEATGFACGDQGIVCVVNDACDGNGSCTDNGFVTAGSACGDPTNNQCTSADTCSGTGVCNANHQPSGTACGDATDTECTNPDTCDGIGACLANHEPAATACGSATITDCSDADSCNGSGVCNPNNAPSGTTCGDIADTDCTNPDSCDNAGVCLENNEPAGTTCTDNGLFCDGTELCDNGGACESQGDPCATPNVCGELSDSCVLPPWINEFHYDNTGTDTNEFLEVAVPAGIDLTQLQVVLYNGSGGATYGIAHFLNTFLPGVTVNGITFYSKVLPVDGLQNGTPDGLALVLNGVVLQLLSYEGTFTATNGPAINMMSLNIGVAQEPASGIPVGSSLGLTGTGSQAGDFTWASFHSPPSATPGAPNTGQTIN